MIGPHFCAMMISSNSFARVEPMDHPEMNKTREDVEDTGRFAAHLNGLQQRLENYSREKTWVSAWKERLKRLFSLKIGVSAAASSFYLLFSVFPLIILTFSLLELLDLGLVDKFELAMPALSAVIPQEILSVLRDFLDSVGRTSSIPFLSVFILGLLWAASRGAGNTVAALNRIYHARSRYNFLFLRLLGIVAIFVIGIILSVILLLLAFNRFLIEYLEQFFILPDFLLKDEFGILANLIAFILLTFIFTVVFTLLKRQRHYLRLTMLSAMLTAVGWIVISHGLSYFIALQTRYYLMYGSITGIIFLMLWLYLAVYIIMSGAFIHAELIRKYPRRTKEEKAREDFITI